MAKEIILYSPNSPIVGLFDRSYAARVSRKYTDECIATLVDAMRNGDSKERIVAAQALLDRGYGKPSEKFAEDTSLADNKSVERSLNTPEVQALLLELSTKATEPEP